MAEEKPGQHHPHPGHRDKSAQTEKPGPHHDHPGHTPGDLDQHGHRDKGDAAKR